MKRIGLIRLGGLAAMVGGILYASQTYLLRPLDRTLARVSDTELMLWDFYVVMVGFVALLALSVMAIVALDAQKGGRYGLIATLASLTVAAGGTMVFLGFDITPPVTTPVLILIAGALVVFLGLTALGIVTIAAGVLPWWCGVVLIASPIFAILGPTVLGPLGGVAWALVGYAIFRAGGRRTQQPPRVR
jgi:hypothetical protein